MLRRKTNITAMLLSIVVIVLLVAGCGSAKQNGTQANPPQKSVQEQMVSIYYGDQDVSKLYEQKVNIQFSKDEEKYLATLEALKVTPNDASQFSLFKGFNFSQVQVDKGLITVDLTFSAENHLGSPGENLIMQAIERTLFQFPELDAIQILVNGKKVDSLMGHMELPHPIRRNS